MKQLALALFVSAWNQTEGLYGIHPQDCMQQAGLTNLDLAGSFGDVSSSRFAARSHSMRKAHRRGSTSATLVAKQKTEAEASVFCFGAGGRT